MEFQDVVRRRRMVRQFTDEPVPDASVDRILRNALRGPSAGFAQGQAFLLFQGAELRKFWEVLDSFADYEGYEGVRRAPVVIVPFSARDAYLDRYARDDKGWTDRDEARWPVPFWFIDTGMATLLILQTAVDEGLGALYFGIVPQAVAGFRAAFGVPDEYVPIGAVAIGHDGEETKPDHSARRRPFEQMVHVGRW